MRHWPGLMGFAAIMMASACTGTPQAVSTGTSQAVGTRTLQPSTPGSVVSNQKWWIWRDVNCFPPAMVRVVDNVMPVGDCAGLLLVPARKVTLLVGEKIEVHMLEKEPFFTLPRSSAPAVLRLIAASPDGVAGTYSALQPGRAMLISHAWCVGFRVKREIMGRCPVLDVSVIP
jgi:hypothetical protein